MDMQEAASLLADASRVENGAPAPQAPETPSAEQGATPREPSAPEVEQGTTSTEDSFTGLDPNSLPEEVLPFFKSMQADYTRSKQSIAEQRRQFEEMGVDPSQAAEAVNFVRALSTDPQVAQTVYRELHQALTEQGMSPAEAHSAASDAMTEDAGWDEDVEFSGGPDPEIQSLKRELEDLKGWKDNFYREQETARITAEVERQEMGLRQAHPELGDDDVAYVYDIAIARGVDLNAAFDAFDSLVNSKLVSYIQRKGSVPTEAPSSTGSAQVPSRVSLEDGSADAAALEMLRADWNSQG